MAGGRSAESKTVGSQLLPASRAAQAPLPRETGNSNTSLWVHSFNKYLLSTYCCVTETDKNPCSQGAPTLPGGAS